MPLVAGVGFCRCQNLCRAFVPFADLRKQLDLMVGLGAGFSCCKLSVFYCLGHSPCQQYLTACLTVLWSSPPMHVRVGIIISVNLTSP
jgi:hypothetical protein